MFFFKDYTLLQRSGLKTDHNELAVKIKIDHELFGQDKISICRKFTISIRNTNFRSESNYIREREG